MSFVFDPGNEDRPPNIDYHTLNDEGVMTSHEPLFTMRRIPWTVGDDDEGEVQPGILEMERHATCVVGPDDDAGGFWTCPTWVYWTAFPDALQFAEGHNREDLIADEKEAGTNILYQGADSGLIIIGHY